LVGREVWRKWTTVVRTSTHPRRHEGSPPASGDSDVPVAPIREIESVDDFNAVCAGGRLLVITDTAKLHPAPGRCRGVTETNFVGKVIERGGRGGRYYTVVSESAARGRWPRMTICGICG
jgi:hypothetical protein